MVPAAPTAVAPAANSGTLSRGAAVIGSHLFAALPYLGPQGAGALARTCRHLNATIRTNMQNETALLQLLRTHFPQFTPRRDIGGAPMCSAFQAWQRLGARSLQAACLKSFQVQGTSPSYMDMTPDGRRVLLGGANGGVILMNPETCHSRIIGRHGSMVTCMQMFADGTRALSGDSGHTLMVWDLDTGTCLRTIEARGQTFCLQTTRDGRRAISGGAADGTLRVWNLETGECLKSLIGHSGPANHLQMTPDERRAVSSSWDKTVKIWDLETGECVRTLPPHGQHITSLQITPDGRKVLTGFADGLLRLSDLESGETLLTFQGGEGENVVDGAGDNRTDSIGRLQITPDGRRALGVFGFRTLTLWDLETGESLRTFAGHRHRGQTWHRGQINCLQMTPDGRRAVSGGEDGTSKLWDLETGECLQTFVGHKDSTVPRIRCLQITHDGTRVLSANESYLVKLWELLPLLEERLRGAYEVCGNPSRGVYEALCSLPQCVQDDLLAIERALRRASAERGNGSLGLDEPHLIRKCLEIYIATQIALPDIRASLGRAVHEPIFFVESIRRICNLQLSIRDALYRNLHEIHRVKGSLPQPTPGRPQPTPENYGEGAFHSENGCSPEERIEAVSRTIAEYERMLSGAEAVTQPRIANQPPITARIVVRHHGNPDDRLFIHGSGPGMQSWQQGIEMRHENGLWVYESTEPFERFEFKILLNDQLWEMGANHTISTGVPVVLHSVTFPVLPPPFTARIVVRYQGNAGDRLYIRGSGLGTWGWQRGREMRHENGLWIFESTEPFERFEFKVMLNDQVWEAGENHTISAGVPFMLDVVTFQDSR